MPETMERPRFEVADVVRAHGEEYARMHSPSAAQAKVLGHILACRTATLGGHVDACDDCGHQRISYNSCRDRHCPKCQGGERARWVEERMEHLLPVPYFHVVFTIPDELNPLALRNKAQVFALLFQTASATLQTLAADPKRLGATLGITTVLHTWGQNLLFHPHLHCVVTGGGLSLDETRWVHGRPGYLLPVRVLGKMFRGKFLDALHRAWKKGKFDLQGSTAELADPVRWAAFKDGLYRKDWVVYAKRPFGGPAQVYRYLGNYTHRIALSNHRLVSLSDGKVSFTWKDYRDGYERKVMTLEAVEFLRRFLLHVLPPGFVRIRHYGLHAPRHLETKLGTAKRLLSPKPTEPAQPHPPPRQESWSDRLLRQTGFDAMACPACGGRLHRTEQFPRSSLMPALARGPP